MVICFTLCLISRRSIWTLIRILRQRCTPSCWLCKRCWSCPSLLWLYWQLFYTMSKVQTMVLVSTCKLEATWKFWNVHHFILSPTNYGFLYFIRNFTEIYAIQITFLLSASSYSQSYNSLKLLYNMHNLDFRFFGHRYR